MESLPQEILKEITKRLPLRWVARLAQTSKSFNCSIWSLITILDQNDSLRMEESTRLDKFNNLESLSLHYFASVIPQDLSKLTTLQKLKFNTVKAIKKQDLSILQLLKNLRELVVVYKDSETEKLDDLLTDQTRLTKLEIYVDNLQNLDPFTWEIMTRLRHLKLFANYNYGGSYKVPVGFLSTLWTLTQLRGLSLSNVILDQLEPETGLSKLSNLEALELADCRLVERENRGWMINYNELRDLKKLTSLEIMDVNSRNEQSVDVIENMTQLVDLDYFEMEGEYKLSLYSNLKNLTRIYIDLALSESDPGLEFSQIPNLEVVSMPWCPNVTQLVHSKKLRKLDLHEGSHKMNERALDFLNELETVKELTIYARQLPDDGIVGMKGMTNLMYLDIILAYNSNERDKVAVCKFVQGLSVLPSLVSLSINESISRELFEIIVTSLTQLQTLKDTEKRTRAVRSRCDQRL